jgi:hypothetical protein
MRFIVEIEVNEEKLRSATENDSDSVDFILESEFGWLQESGISIVSLKKKDLYNESKN